MKKSFLDKLNRLSSFLKRLDSLVIAYSGGVDSTFLLYMAKENVKGKVIAVTSVSKIHKRREIRDAEIMAKEIGVEHIRIDTGELSMKEFLKNERERCYFCKKNLFKRISEIAKEHGIFYVAHGANLDDMNDFRPGNRAAEEMNILSPLVYAGLRKDEIREISKEISIKIWNKPASPCLATRIPYGKRITEKAIEMIDKAEEFLENIGFKEVRVRYYDQLAKIEVPEKMLTEVIERRKEISKKLKEIGFSFISLDIDGFFSGKLNLAL